MRFSQVICFLLMVFPCLVLGADEGGPAWWWDCKQDDFIVRGELTYGDQPYITSTWTNEGKTLTAYYIKAKLKIAEVLYLNPNNRYPDNYMYYLSHMDTQQDVLILAQRVYSDHMKTDAVKVTPTENILKGAVVMILNVDYVFPVGGLVLQSVVPDGKTAQALELIQKRLPMKTTAEPSAAPLPRAPQTGHSEGER